MRYECQSCYAVIEEEDLSHNSVGDPECPECGSLDLSEFDDMQIFNNDEGLDNDGSDNDGDEDHNTFGYFDDTHDMEI